MPNSELGRALPRAELPTLRRFTMSKSAGVLVLLHVNSVGGLSVTLTTRALTLRTHPGQTALPGGRYDEGDDGLEGTAVSVDALRHRGNNKLTTPHPQLREANEEILLPLPPATSLLHLATLPAFTSRTLLHVVPSVFLLLDPPLPVLSRLVPSPAEVSAIFHLPLRAFLGFDGLEEESTAQPATRQTRSATAAAPLPQAGTEKLTYFVRDFEWLEGRVYRQHMFIHPDARVTPTKVSGLTSDVLIATALIGYHGLDAEGEAAEGRSGEEGSWRTGFARWAEGQMSWVELDRAARVARVEWEAGKGLGEERVVGK